MEPSMDMTTEFRFIKRVAIAMIAAASLQANAQTIQDGGVVADPYNPQPGTPIVAAPIDKAAGGAKFAMTIPQDTVRLYITFISGQTGVGTFPDCHNLAVAPWTFTLSLDGTVIATTSGNLWNNITANNPPICGLNYIFTDAAQYQVLTPGVFQAKMTQGGATTTANLTLPPCLRPLPVYSSRHDAYTDNFYTTVYSDHTYSLTLGYHETGVGFENALSSRKTAPWKRYFHGLPELEHFYTHLPGEQSYVTSVGYVYARDEGNVVLTPLTGTLPLYRLTQFFPATGDLEHAYTTSSAGVASYQAAGYSFEGTLGYVCP
jgi:hypothetical protein